MLRFYTVDVFTTSRYSGNPLAVVLAADELSTDQMLAIAGEFNLSETTFVCKPDDATNTAKVRIFTPRAEMPFAGHPNVGTAWVLANFGEPFNIKPVDGRFNFEEIAGLVPVDLIETDGKVSGARLTSPKPLSVDGEVPVAVVASACGLEAADINVSHHEPTQASCGSGFIFVEVNDRATLSRASPRSEVFENQFDRDWATGVLLYTRDLVRDNFVHARMFAPLHGVAEDPATGSANVALVGLLAHLTDHANTTLNIEVEQGRDMGRTSLLRATAVKENGVVTATQIGGHCAGVMSGTLAV